MFNKRFVALVVTLFALVLSREAEAQSDYNFPSHSKVEIVRDPNGASYLYLEFMWDKNCPPEFKKGTAIEFEIGITPKYFIQPKGGKDENFSCYGVLGDEGFGFKLPNRFIPDVGLNCYVDVWNYMDPGSLDIGSELNKHCGGGLDLQGQTCAFTAAIFGAFSETRGNFAVGLHDASALKAGEKYFFKYPVEINYSSTRVVGDPNDGSPPYDRECANSSLQESAKKGYYSGDQLSFEFSNARNDWGRVQITMQTFNNECDLPKHCELADTAYTCPHLIGIASPLGSCENVQKKTDWWLTKLCAPTGEYTFTPGIALQSGHAGECLNNQNTINLDTNDECCIDLDGDGYYANSSSELYGTQVGDCDDNDPQVLQCTTCSPGSCPSGEWCQPSSGACSSCDGGCYGIHQSTCETQCGVTPCIPDCQNKCGGASDGCDGTCNGCPTAHNCENMSCVSCGGGNEPCCLQGSECYSNLTCQNGVCSSVSVSSIDDVAAGEYHTCAVVNGEARCFGNNQDGQLGNGSTSNALTPTAVKGVGGSGTLTGVLSVSAGGSHTCALLNTGKVVCWGFNPYGQLGNGATTQSTVPVEVLGPNGNGVLSNVTEISTGHSFTCARTNGSSVYCWGQLPFGSVGGAHPEPEQLPATTNVLEISAGGEHLCLRKTDNSIWCVGDNYYGQLGNGSSSVSSLPSPVQVVAALNIPLSAQGLPKNLGTEHSCAWVSPGSTYCWGSAGLSQVTGTGSGSCEGGYACEKKAIVAISSSGGLAVGSNHTCSLKNGVVMCWGSNSHGQVGSNAANSCSGSNACSYQEVNVEQCGSGSLAASQVAAGGDHTCAVTSSGLMCWGRNLSGELGNGTTVNSSCPIAVSGL